MTGALGNDPLISEYLPAVKGHIAKNYAWMARRGNCLITIDDLQQIASIALVHLVAEWDDILAEQSQVRDGNNGLFWTFLKHRVKAAVNKYTLRVAHNDRPRDHSADDIEENPDQYSTDVRTALSRLRPDSMLQQQVVDYFSVMPRRDKLLIALRYFDELTQAQVADLTGVTPKVTAAARERLREYARNQCIDAPTPIAMTPRPTTVWEPPSALVDYLEMRYHMDIAEYLGWVTICLRADVSYLVDIIDLRQLRAPGSVATGISPYQAAQADAMLADGLTRADVARELGLSWSVVSAYAKRRRSTLVA